MHALNTLAVDSFAPQAFSTRKKPVIMAFSSQVVAKGVGTSRFAGMPARRGGNARLHQRTASTASSKQAVANTNAPQVVVANANAKGGLKRNGNSAVELNTQRNGSPHHRNAHFNASHRIKSRDRVQSRDKLQPLQQQKRAQTPLSSKQKQPSQKAGFSIARSEDDDDDEWVSSESGAATPLQLQEEDQSVSAPANEGSDSGGSSDLVSHANGVTTPRAASESEDLPRVETARADLPSQDSSQLSNSTQTLPPPVNEPPEADIYRQIRSEAPSPTRRRFLPKRNPLLRNSSHGDYKVEMPHHPLIRGQSFQVSLKPKPLAPLTVNPEAVQVQITSSPTSTGTREGYSSSSPTSMINSITLQTPTSAHPDQRPSRKSSISSLHSVATLPVPSPSRLVGLRSKPDRTRTISTISSSSSSAALTSLNALPTMSRPGTPPLVVHFPIENRRDASEGIHQLLPPPIRSAHAMFISRNKSLSDSLERVMRARAGK